MSMRFPYFNTLNSKAVVVLRNIDGVMNTVYKDIVIEETYSNDFEARRNFVLGLAADYRAYSIHAYFLVLQDFDFVDLNLLNEFVGYYISNSAKYIDFEDLMNILNAITGCLKSLVYRK